MQSLRSIPHFSLFSVLFFGFAATTSAQKNISIGKVYAYYKTMPGQGSHYRDDGPIGGLHIVHTTGLGAFDFGNLTDAAVSASCGTGPGTTHLAIRGSSANAPPADIIFDLGGPCIVIDFVIGTVVSASLNNNAPDDVTVSYSNKTTAPGDFGSAKFYDLEKAFGPLADGHHDLSFKGSGIVAKYVKFAFDGGSMAEPNGTDPNEKYLLDEIAINGIPLSCIGAATNYGVGLAGKNGVPTLATSAPPVFLKTINLLASNSSGAASTGMFVVGLQATALPFLDGWLLTNPLLLVSAPLPSAGLVFPIKIPGGICGIPIYLQFLQLDVAASSGVSMSRGLKIDAGS